MSMDKLEQAKAHGKPVYVPSGEIKGWEFQGDLVRNPDYTPPKVVAPKVEPIQHKCGRCGSDISHTRNKMLINLQTITVCDQCYRFYGGQI